MNGHIENVVLASLAWSRCKTCVMQEQYLNTGTSVCLASCAEVVSHVAYIVSRNEPLHHHQVMIRNTTL